MIPREWEGSDYYADLGIPRTANQADIRAAHRAKVKIYHPDVYQGADHSDQFERVSRAYEVLGNPKSRAEYDLYLFIDGPVYVAPERLERFRGKTGTLLFRIAVFVLILFLLTHQGIFVTSKLPTSTSGSASFGQQASPGAGNSGNRNQILVLMVGPSGPPGPAGVAGKNGFIGMNGYQGKDGLPGAPGTVGPPGATGPQGAPGIAGVNGAPGPQGLPGATGPAGAAGAAGSAGAAGAAGPPGINGTPGINGAPGEKGEQGIQGVPGPQGSPGAAGSNAFGQSFVLINSCTPKLHVAIEDRFDKATFTYKLHDFKITEVDSACDGSKLDLEIKLGNIENVLHGDHYNLGDVIHCTKSVNATGTITVGAAECTNPDDTSGLFVLTDVNALDISSSGPALAVQISSL